MVHIFEDTELDTDLYQLRRAGRPIKLEPKVFNLLAYLIAHRDRVVPKRELFEQLWPGEFVTDSALTYCIKAARKAVGDDGSVQRVVATVRGRGYRFVADAANQRALTSSAGAPASDQHQTALPGAHPFVGRVHVMATLQRAVAAAAGGRGQLVLLTGEPGIGKTRTADELANFARTRKLGTLVGRCYEGEGAPPFWPWRQILRTHLQLVERASLPALLGHGADDLVQLVPELAQWLPALAGTRPRPDTAQARFRLFETVSDFLATASRQQPLLLILDDIHWADQPSLLLLQFIARAMTDSRLVIVATYRDTDVRPHHPLAHALGDLARAPNSLRLQLDGLGAEDVAHFIESALGRTPSVSLVTAVYQETEGNPFFVTEVVHLLSSSGQLDQVASTFAAPLAVPPTVRDAISRRVAQLSPACAHLLAMAAVIGREFSLASLLHLVMSSRASGKRAVTDRTAVLDCLDEARAASIVDLASQTHRSYRFVHTLIRETLYEALPTAERVDLHRRVGEVLEQAPPSERVGRLSELAHHFAQVAVGGEVRKGVEYAIRAGDHAAAQLAYEEAAAQYERALQFMATDPRLANQRGEVLLALGHNQWRAGDFTLARATFHEAAEVARADGAPERFARAALGYGGGFRGFTLGIVSPILIDLLEEALVQLPAPDSALRAQVMARHAVALYDIPGSLARRDTLSLAAVEMAERIGDTAAHVGALCCRHWATWGPDNLADRCSVAAAMVSLSERVGDQEMALQAHRFHLIDSLEVGDLDQVTADLAACAALAEQLRQPYYTWYVLGFRALRAFLDGRFSDSERFSQEALTIGQRAQSPNINQMYGAQMLALRREQGRSGEVEPMLQGLVAQFPTVPSWRCGLAYVLTELNRLDDARVQFATVAVGEFSGIPRDTFWLVGVSALGDVCATLGDTVHAAELYRQLLPYRERNAVNVVGTCSTSVARPLGRLAATLQQWEAASDHFDAALRIEQRLGSPHLLAHTRHDYAAMLLARGGPGDAPRAHQLLASAIGTFGDLGMTHFANRSRTLLTQAQTRAAKRKGRAQVISLGRSAR